MNSECEFEVSMVKLGKNVNPCEESKKESWNVTKGKDLKMGSVYNNCSGMDTEI